MKNLTWNNLLFYPKFSKDLENSLNRIECPDEIIALFDRILWYYLSGVPFSEELTIREAYVLEEWAKNIKITQSELVELLAIELDNQLGIKFKS